MREKWENYLRNEPEPSGKKKAQSTKKHSIKRGRGRCFNKMIGLVLKAHLMRRVQLPDTCHVNTPDIWWAITDSNRGPPACKAGALTS